MATALVLICNTAKVKFHETFWVAIATATPVIALANTVSIGDVVSQWFNTKARRRSWQSRFYYGGIIFLAATNLLSQAVLLNDALQSLLKEYDYRSPVTDIIFTVGGLIYVLVLVLYSVVLRYQLRADETRDAKAEENSKASKPDGGRRSP
jgi:protein-S-isoprenylcysteine O-methyltransferase Ste14